MIYYGIIGHVYDLLQGIKYNNVRRGTCDWEFYLEKREEFYYCITCIS